MIRVDREIGEGVNVEAEWKPDRPIDIFLPDNIGTVSHLHKSIIKSVAAQLGSRIYYSSPAKVVQNPDNSRVLVVCAEGKEDIHSEVRQLFKTLPGTKPLVFIIRTTDHIEEPASFVDGRGLLATGPANNGMLVEKHTGRYLRSSTQGNMNLDSDMAKLAMWFAIHNSAPSTTQRRDGQSLSIDWETWCKLVASEHAKMSNAALTLGCRGLIDDKVDLSAFYNYRYCDFSDPRLLETLPRLVGKEGYGESARFLFSQKTGVMLATRTGQGKVNVSKNPEDGHLVPVSGITKRGYLVRSPYGSPITYQNGSVETYEMAKCLAYLDRKQRGFKYTNPQIFIKEISRTLEEYPFIPISGPDVVLPEIAIDHVHGFVASVKEKWKERLLLVRQSPYFPKIDFPCGTDWSADMLFHTLFQIPQFRIQGAYQKPLHDFILGAELWGHGIVLLAEDREMLTEFMADGCEWMPAPHV